jgi:hypothetical protein
MLSVKDWIESRDFDDVSIDIRKDLIVVSGTVAFKFYYEGYETILSDKFTLKILVYRNYPEKIPDIVELDNKIPDDFHKNGRSLCLGTPLEMLLYANTNCVEAFLDKYLTSYLMSFMFYREYGICPYGDRSHGAQGKLEHLKEYFNVSEEDLVLQLLNLAITNDLGRNEKCCCLSGLKFKKCHLKEVEYLKRSISKHNLEGTYKELSNFVKI